MAGPVDNFVALAGLYAIGVVGAICVNLGSCALNKSLEMHWAERGVIPTFDPRLIRKF